MDVVSTDVIGAVREARSHARPEDVIEGVKRAVADEVRRLDPALKVSTTSYFNHTYVPDLVAEWRESGKAQTRAIFIRGSLEAVSAGDDVRALADQQPMLIGLQEERREAADSLRLHMPKSTRTLATDLSATSRITSGHVASSSVNDSPLTGLVRANIVRDGRGVLASADADRITAVDEGEPAVALEAFGETVRELFTGATAERLTRTVDLLSAVFEESPSAVQLTQLAENPLRDSELRAVLPFILARADSVRSSEVWEILAASLTLSSIESLAPALANLDLTPLIRPAAASMVAVRSALFFNGAELTDEEMNETQPKWLVKNGRLAADIRQWTLWLASDARKLKGRDDGPDARWDELSAPLRDFVLTGIELRGLSRQLSVANEKSDTVRADVEQIRVSIDDDFHVGQVSVRERGADEKAPALLVDFGASTVTGKATADFHARVAALLAVKRPIAAADLDTLL